MAEPALEQVERPVSDVLAEHGAVSAEPTSGFYDLA
jgi:hypothetical protein